MRRRHPGVRDTCLMATSDRVEIPTAAHVVASAIRRQIVTGDLQDGESLPPEALLIDKYGVSRPTFREAMRILQSEGLISTRRGSRGGARVNAPSIEPIARQAGYLLQHQETTLGDVYEARAILEPPAARALAKATKATQKSLRAALDAEVAAKEDPATFARASAAFHEEVIRLAGNNTLGVFAGILHEIITDHSESVYRDEADIEGRARRSGEAHTKLVELVEAGDQEAAEAHWRQHLDEIGELMRKSKALARRIDLFG